MPPKFLDSPPQHQDTSHLAGVFLDGRNVCELDVQTLKDTHLKKLGHYTKEFLWLGSPWTCKKKRRHYQSFRRNGVKISVNDFVHVLAEEDKRLAAHLEDMYEDSRGNKMVVVRWFHKIDEVGVVLPPNFNDREIFFSLCLQDLSIECIDGLATVLSPQHFEKFLNEATHTRLEPFVCYKLFENDDVKPFDITQIKGYWKQEILVYMYTLSPSNAQGNSQHFDGLKAEENVNDTIGIRPKKRLCQSKEDDVHLQYTNRIEPMHATLEDVQNLCNSGIDRKCGTEICRIRGGGSAAILSKGDAKQNPLQYLTVGSQVEVLSQDSGIRGCWFRALIIKKHKDKVKVQYKDILDATDESKKLEEWIIASRVAAPDHLGLRISGRTTVRPPPQCNKGRVSWAVDVGAVVDVWRHDGWWEGIVVQKEAEDELHVYFPGEKQESIFGRDDLRHSQEWLGSGWVHVKDRPDLLNLILSSSETKSDAGKSSDGKPAQATVPYSRHSKQDETGSSDFRSDSEDDKAKLLEAVRDLSKDDLLAQLRWKSSRKRRRGGGISVQKLRSKIISCERFLIPTSMKVDHENCKYMGDSLFSTSVVSSLSSLVMSR
ncbi:uncharacterized protein LOC132184193 isoform X2 [Corylus avellana]|uniref:uncharacterized protein LOC132184193 isoform X2 n=1 Tax=Corylus avellana TaxID=13451 RepID=UPI00286B0441|nr:uncharacterized protein LOC132184193 isoform X2 [Corylus avellana]